MAKFCAFFPWCSPDRFWDLTLDEFAVLQAVLEGASG